jgi:hypothetical protein
VAYGHGPYTTSGFTQRVLPVGARRPFDKLRAVPSTSLRDGERSRAMSEVEPRLAPTSLLPPARCPRIRGTPNPYSGPGTLRCAFTAVSANSTPALVPSISQTSSVFQFSPRACRYRAIETLALLELCMLTGWLLAAGDNSPSNPLTLMGTSRDFSPGPEGRGFRVCVKTR